MLFTLLVTIISLLQSFLDMVEVKGTRGLSWDGKESINLIPPRRKR
jgi:hypothetical protein